MYIFLIFFFYAPVALVHFVRVVFLGRKGLPPVLLFIIELLAVLIFPLLFLLIIDGGAINDCCDDNAFFSPAHRLTIRVIIFLCMAAYFYSGYRKRIAAPLAEIAVNCFLIIGIVLNVLITLQAKGDGWVIYIFGTAPVILLFIVALVKNQQLLMEYLQTKEFSKDNFFNRFCWKLLSLHPAVKTPLFILLCLPLLVIITGVLLLFGQKPDSLVRAFTDTYHQTFSQLNHECDNVNCGGHYLCSVAAKGHKRIVKPQRLGERAGNAIICNRQLLVSNAFEELLQQKLPFLHKPVRRAYNNVGHLVHRYYSVFNNRYVADAVYIMMKPLEWFFVAVLYTFDQNPENRIAVQYLSKAHRQQISQGVAETIKQGV